MNRGKDAAVMVVVLVVVISADPAAVLGTTGVTQGNQSSTAGTSANGHTSSDGYFQQSVLQNMGKPQNEGRQAHAIRDKVRWAE